MHFSEGKHMSIRELVRRAHTLWDNPHVPEYITRHNRKAWVRSVVRLGDRWLLAQKVRRIQ
jgi:hypothetical protein